MAQEIPDIHKQADVDGRFRRQHAQFRSSISKGGAHPPAPGRYVLYVSLTCPWACRALIVRALKGLQRTIELAVVSPTLGERGWAFTPDVAGCTPDPVLGARFVSELYRHADPAYEARYTVPILWDRVQATIVNNESSEIIRMFNVELDEFVEERYRGVTFYPEALRGEIDGVNDWVYNLINNGVYKTGFATTQVAYEENVYPLFDALDRVEKILQSKTFLCGPGAGELTEADIRLFTTIVRFDPAYHGAFKCNLRTIRDGYPAIERWLRALYWGADSAFRDATNFEHLKKGYYTLGNLNPSGVVPLGPLPNIRGTLEE